MAGAGLTQAMPGDLVVGMVGTGAMVVGVTYVSLHGAAHWLLFGIQDLFSSCLLKRILKPTNCTGILTPSDGEVRVLGSLNADQYSGCKKIVFRVQGLSGSSMSLV